MKISARNLLEGKIKEVRKGATTAHVEIELKGGETVISSITNEAVEELGLKKGTQAYAVIKASDVMIAIKLRGRQAKFARTSLPFGIPFRSLAGYGRSAAIPPRWS